jgi:PTH1 family peptidyl-tRNA hydrolase
LKLVVGLGNPGEEYATSRHNVGFMVVEKLAQQHGKKFKKMFWFPARQARIEKDGQLIHLLEPTTYMNRSGKAVFGAMKKWRVPPEDTVIIYDDVDLNLGEIRVRAKGSGGSHNGMKSVKEWIQTQRFPRIRVGVGPRPKQTDLIKFVLDDFTNEEIFRLEKVVEHTANAVESIFSVGIEQTMNIFNQPKSGLS